MKTKKKTNSPVKKKKKINEINYSELKIIFDMECYFFLCKRRGMLVTVKNIH